MRGPSQNENAFLFDNVQFYAPAVHWRRYQEAAAAAGMDPTNMLLNHIVEVATRPVEQFHVEPREVSR